METVAYQVVRPAALQLCIAGPPEEIPLVPAEIVRIIAPQAPVDMIARDLLRSPLCGVWLD
ncbi:MAG: hypothetical protein KatS3mg131_3378 [Candidatus Tectimicrobiota bacterium]|nr:MAG: hypothetical protein KatS3mg131_3378 [Candidatus Tectomicrobia bacterium]